MLFLTAKDATEDKVAGLSAGGDDYVTKPFSLDEVIARIRAILRRSRSLQEEDTAILRVDDLSLNTDTHEVFLGEEEIDLSPTEFNLLHYLMLNANRVLSKAQILDHVWEYDFNGDSSIVESYISYLRRKIDNNREGHEPLIHTKRGVGYMGSWFPQLGAVPIKLFNREPAQQPPGGPEAAQQNASTQKHMGRRPLERIPFTLSLRTQLVLVTSALIALAIVVTSLVAISALRAQMVHQLDDEMKANSANLLSLVSNNSQHPVQEATLGSYHVYLLDEHGNTLYALSPDTSSRDEPQVTGWTADKVRKNNGELLAGQRQRR